MLYGQYGNKRFAPAKELDQKIYDALIRAQSEMPFRFVMQLLDAGEGGLAGPRYSRVDL